MVYHNYNILVLHVFVIGMVAAADKLSVDARLKRKQSMMSRDENNWQYGWLIRLLSSITIGSYILAGLAKVMGELTWGWIDGSAMRSQIAVDALRKEMFGGVATPLFEFLYPYTILFTIMGIVSLILELGAFIALTNRHIGVIWALITCSMHWGILFIMGIDFPYHYTGIIFLSFFPLEKAWFMLRRLLNKKREVAALNTSMEANLIVLFDSVCNFCDANVRFIIDRENKNVFQFTSIQSKTGQDLLKQYNAPSDLSTIVLIDKELGRVYTKSSAILYIAKYLKAPWFLAYAFTVVPKPLRDMAYTIFAKNRYHWFGQKDVCEVPSVEMQSRFLQN
jgi:predicted DCC family thiol-disulfide oxidoreductase YuxK